MAVEVPPLVLQMETSWMHSPSSPHLKKPRISVNELVPVKLMPIYIGQAYL